MKNNTLFQKLVSLLVCMALIFSYIPVFAAAAENPVVNTVADPGTTHTWESMMGTSVDGNRYAGRVWVDKSVYKSGDTALLNTRGEEGSSFRVELEQDETFQVIFSALGSTMSSKNTVTSTGPMDVVLVLDTSTSMDDEDRQGVTRLERTIQAANLLLGDLLTIQDVRIAIVTYNRDSETVIPLASYTNGVKLVVNNYYNNNTRLGNDSGYTMGTNLQSGIDRGFNILANATNTQGRIPVSIVLTDGQANRADSESFYNITGSDSASGTNLYLSTLLNAAYNKTKVEAHYGQALMVYGVGVDLGNNTTARLLMNPADPSYGFHANNSAASEAYRHFENWARGNTVTTGGNGGWGSWGSEGWTFDHNYPNLNGAVTDAKIAANIHYVDTYYDVTNADLQGAFEQIYEELTSGAFNPISSSTTTAGGTGVENTPLIYVDFIGQHMEIKEIQALTIFGSSYGVVKHEDGTYTVSKATGKNPATNESWDTAEDVQITVTEETDGTQKLEVRINQEILPITMEQVTSETVGNVTTSTITELAQDPLRLFYTVGVDSDILLPNGKVDVSKLQGYQQINDADGTVSFYAGQFGEMNPADGSGTVRNGDAHVGFKPSKENRYYYYQDNHGIFTKITSKSNGSVVTIPENAEYGIVWDESKYELSWMTYEEYLAARDSDVVYTYVNYYHPTPENGDAAGAAEEVTYLVYTEWKYLKESVAFYDNNTGTYLDDGKAIPEDRVADVIAAYKQANPNAELYAVLGIGALRTSRLHNMTVSKGENGSQNLSDTAENRYAPEYTHDTAAVHNGNDVVVWLGNNGVVTLEIETGIALTKVVTEAIGDPDDLYELTVTVPSGVVAEPQVVNGDGEAVAFTYAGNVLTVGVKAGQTVYISGIPGGTECVIGENIGGDYYIQSKTDVVRVPLVSEALSGAAQFAPATVTNAPHKYGNLFITKRIESAHTVPDSVLNTSFHITVNVGAALAGKTFTVEDSAHTAPYQVTVDNAGELTFQIKARQTIALFSLPAGTPVTVTEANPGDHFAVSYITRNHSGETPDTDNALIIPYGGNATALVTNTYTPDPVSVELEIAGTKNFIAEGDHDGGRFVYQVEKWNGSGWEPIPGKTAETPYAANEAGTKTFTIEDVLSGITYTEIGSHAYRVVEVKGDVQNVTYDRTVYTFNVTVTDNGGQLVAAVTDRNNAAIADGSYEVTFNNTYHTVPVSVDVKKIVDNKSGDNTVSLAGFAFLAQQVDDRWQPIAGGASFTIYSDAAGNARFTSVCTQQGVHRFLLTEVAGNAPGWTYSGAEYRITVTISNDTGDLTAAVSVEAVNSRDTRETVVQDAHDLSNATVSFVNTYDPQDASVDMDGSVTKVLTGMTLAEDQFTFYVYADGDRTAPVLVGTNKENGDVHFVDFDKALTFEKAGTYKFDVVESIPTGAAYDAASGKYVLDGMYYDATIYDLMVEVTNDPATGKLVARCYFEDAVSNRVTFYNDYKAAPTAYTLGGHKLLHGRTPRDGEFAFRLYRGEELLETVANKADGSFSFKPITYTKAGVYTYTIREVAGSVPGVVYTGAGAPITVTVTVTDTNGVLSATADIQNENIVFENSYNAKPAQVTFNGTKTLKGGELQDNAFTFKLYSTDRTFDITGSNAALLAITQNVDGAFSFARTLEATGTYYFVILEDTTDPAPDVVYDRTQHKFMVRVTDIGDGQLKAAITNAAIGVSTPASAEASAKVSFVNALFEEATEKEVYLEGSTATEIDGKKVSAGDILTYFITYTNYTGENVVADIVDVIPAHTSYVEGSATLGGSYVGAHINWVLNVAKGESVTVSFRVKVEEREAIVANTAVVRDGVNTYHTNEVVNHSVESALKKDVFAAADPTVSIDAQQVERGDELLYKISFTNASASAVSIRITDGIPKHTTYVAGSADNGGVFADGTVTWELKDIPAWQTVTVTFKVTVNADVGAVKIENKAFATDGVNAFETETVVNHTVEVPAPPTPPAPPSGPNVPKLSDSGKLGLWLITLTLSCCGFVLTATFGKKKTESK